MVEHVLAKDETGVRFSLPALFKMAQSHPQINIDISKIPTDVLFVVQTLKNKGFEAYLVGGCVRDLIIGREVKDWDITTNATPEQIIPLFSKTVYENNFGTVMVIKEGENEAEKGSVIAEITPYRLETTYSDKRHPDAVTFSQNVEDDLKRRDFTINAMAYCPLLNELIDLYNGQQDLKDKIIRAVGDPNTRFEEDALRLLRAVRFSTVLNFAIESDTLSAIIKNASLIKNISNERIRDEFTKIIMSDSPMIGIGLLEKVGLLKYIIPELEEGIGCEQGGAHIFDVFEHLVQALGHAALKKWPLEVRLAALFHDIGKPRSRRLAPSLLGKAPSKKYTFYGHEVIGARMTQKIMERLKFPNKVTDLVVTLVRQHMFFSDTETITLSAVRRVVAKVGKENIWTLMDIRECDRVGMKKKEAPYRLRKYHAMIEEVLRDPISVSQLKVDGNILMNELNIKPSPRMGWILYSLLEEVLDDPLKNPRDYLDKRVGELDKLSDSDLKALGEKAKETKEELEEEEIAKLHKKHGV